MVAREEEDEVVAEFLPGEVVDEAHLHVHAGDVGEIARPVFAGLPGVDEGGGQGDFIGIVGGYFVPGDVGTADADEEGDGSVVVELIDVRDDFLVHVIALRVEMVRSLEVPRAVGDFSEGGDVVAHALENGREESDAGFDLAVVGMGAVAGRHEAGEQREAIRAAGGRGDIGIVEGHAVGGEAVHGGRLRVGGAVEGCVEAAEVVGEEDDEVGWGG